MDPLSRKFEHWSKVDLNCYQLDDSNVACQIETKVWESGISDEAANKRGELWWGNPSVKEQHLKLSERTPSVGSLLPEVDQRSAAGDGRRVKQERDVSGVGRAEGRLNSINKVSQSVKLHTSQHVRWSLIPEVLFYRPR